MKGVSIVVCCYNSASRLPETLRHIAGQKVSPTVPWEVIVINNASTDNTREAAAAAWNGLQCPVPFSVADENTPGLSAARDKGLELSQYEYLIFCDDDNWLDERYVQLSYEVMESDERIGALGGYFEPVFESEPPAWFPFFAPNYTAGPQVPQGGDITFTRSYVSGAGAVYRKAALLFLKANHFSSLLTDRKGNTLSTGGDVELGYALRMAGYRILYDERLRLQHYMPKERLTREYVERLFSGYLESVPVHLAYEQNFSDRPGYKTTWQWLLLMRLVLAIRKKFGARPENKGQESWIPAFLDRYDRDLIRSLYRHRHTYAENLEKIRQSSWNKTGNVQG